MSATAEQSPTRQRYHVESMIPAPPGWVAVFAGRRHDARQWIELHARPVIALAGVTVYYSRRSGGAGPAEDELAEAELVLHGVVADREGLRMRVAPDEWDGDEWLGYAEAGEPLERWLGEVTNPDRLPIAIPTPEQLRERARRDAAEMRERHGVVEAPWVEEAGVDGE
jgi:hypothetical protein